MSFDFPRWTLWGNTFGTWLVAAGVFVAVSSALFIARTVVARRLEGFARRTSTRIDDAIVTLLRRTRYFFIFALAVVAASFVLVLPSSTRDVIRIVGLTALLLQVAVWGNSLITFWTRGYAERRADIDGAAITTVTAFGLVARIALFTVLLLLALENLGYDVTALLTGLGIAGVAVALAAQNILGDLFAAFSIFADKPFVVGDSIEVDSYAGTVEYIGLKTTRVRSLSGEQIIFSNADLLRSRIRNQRRLEERRVAFMLGLDYETPPEKLSRVGPMIREIIEAQPDTRFDRSHFRRFGDSSLNVETVYFVLKPDYNLYADIEQTINLAILTRFQAEGIEFAFPTRTVVLKNEGAVIPGAR